MSVQLQEAIKTLAKAKKITAEKLVAILREVRDPWQEVKGILGHKRISGTRYQKAIRKEWNR